VYRVGDLIVYGEDGVCRVEEIGPVNAAWAEKGVQYYTLSPIYHSGHIFLPVETGPFTRPIMTREQALELILRIPDIPEQICEQTSPRLLQEQYKASLKSHDSEQWLRLIRSVRAKQADCARRGRHLGQVDERSMKRAEELLHGELAAALDIPVDEVANFIVRTLGEDN